MTPISDIPFICTSPHTSVHPLYILHTSVCPQFIPHISVCHIHLYNPPYIFTTCIHLYAPGTSTICLYAIYLCTLPHMPAQPPIQLCPCTSPLHVCPQYIHPYISMPYTSVHSPIHLYIHCTYVCPLYIPHTSVCPQYIHSYVCIDVCPCTSPIHMYAPSTSNHMSVCHIHLYMSSYICTSTVHMYAPYTPPYIFMPKCIHPYVCMPCTSVQTPYIHMSPVNPHICLYALYFCTLPHTSVQPPYICFPHTPLHPLYICMASVHPHIHLYAPSTSPYVCMSHTPVHPHTSVQPHMSIHV